MIEELLQKALSAATAAGQLIAHFDRDELVIDRKQNGASKAAQVLTQVDILAQKEILNILNPTLDEYDLGLLSEEQKDDLQRLEKDFFWCIDPLDGTLPFIEEGEGYAVSIALVAKEGIPHIGVIYDPVNQTLYHAVKGGGVFKNHQAWSSPLAQANELQVYFDRSFLKDERYEQTLKKLKSNFKNVKVISSKGAVMNAISVLENPSACYFKLPKNTPVGGGSLWDFAATTVLFNESDAWVSDIHGHELELNRKDSTFMGHKGVLFASPPQIGRALVI